MKVVTCYFASQLAQVSKQLIGNQKKVNANSKSKYPYFAFDRNSGDFGVDIESRSWKDYMIKRRSTLRFDLNREKELMGESKGQPKNNESDNNDNVKDFVLLCLSIAQKYISKDKYPDFKNELSDGYRKVIK